MITAEELVGMIEFEDGGSNNTRMATVVDLFSNGNAKLQFDGEETPSQKEYGSLGSYIPSKGDRVILLGASGTWVILGKIRFKESSGGDGSSNKIEAGEIRASDYLYSGRQLTVENQIWSKGTVYVDNTLYARGYFRHQGSYLGFFGKEATYRRSCNTLGASATLVDTIDKLNQVINDLKSYGLYA